MYSLNCDSSDCFQLDVAMKEKRVLLTAGKNYHMAAKQIGVEQVLEVSTLVKAIDQAKYVFRHFGMSLDKSLLFLRCSLCNGDDYITTPAPVVRVAVVFILISKLLFLAILISKF